MIEMMDRSIRSLKRHFQKQYQQNIEPDEEKKLQEKEHK